MACVCVPGWPGERTGVTNFNLSPPHRRWHEAQQAAARRQGPEAWRPRPTRRVAPLGALTIVARRLATAAEPTAGSGGAFAGELTVGGLRLAAAAALSGVLRKRRVKLLVR